MSERAKREETEDALIGVLCAFVGTRESAEQVARRVSPFAGDKVRLARNILARNEATARAAIYSAAPDLLAACEAVLRDNGLNPDNAALLRAAIQKARTV